MQLPLFDDNLVLPTDKCHISYSELHDWVECSFRHKLKHIDKLGTDGPTIHTAFGHVLHGILEQYAINGKMPPMEEAIAELKKMLGELLFTDKSVTQEEGKAFLDVIEPIITQVPDFLDKTFPGWKLISAEDKLFEPIEGMKNRYFKGFIDLVIKVPKVKKGSKIRLSGMKGEEVLGEFVYWVLDYKTTNWGWRSDQKRSFEKQMQLVLYKHFWSTKMSVDTKDVRCGFVFLKRTAKKDGTRIELMPVSVGPKAIEKSLTYLHDSINQIQSRRFIKNKMSCRWCNFAGTADCP